LSSAPSAPVITTVTAIDSYSARVTWQAPAEPGGIITGYFIVYTGNFQQNYVRFNNETVSIDKLNIEFIYWIC